MRVIVTGGRDYDDRATAAKVLAALDPDTVTLVHGDARGADRLVGGMWPGDVESFPADWGVHGNAAGPIRNRSMLRAGADLVIAFPGGRGTEHMKYIAREAGVPVLEVQA